MKSIINRQTPTLLENNYKYFAFISYNAKDTEWGKKLQKKLEHYKLPATLCSKHGWERCPIKPVFFAPTDIQPGGLSEELQERLKAARHLVVICSPNSAKSQWVGREIEFFHKLGRTQNIHFFIVDGSPNSGNPDTECFNPVVKDLELPEILGANIHENIYRWPWLNRERAYVQLISKLLGVEFDTIWQRRKRALIRKTAAWTIGGVAVIAALLTIWRTNQPIDATLTLNEASVHNNNLPPLEDAIVTMRLDNETKCDTIHTLNGSIVFSNIPHRLLNKPVQISVSCRDFLSVDTTLTLTPDMTIDLRRDPKVYGDVVFSLWDWHNETTIADTPIQVEGIDYVSDSSGRVAFFIPLERQKTTYQVTAPFPLADSILTMPCCEGFAIVKE
ncbi:MAG: toll/interleukin-1 receptor domain-containing protein [Bacteroidales bacterium]|nr:toll/interleukin-1 receptor domain-containing protein [Bacteroidales bacterium]